MEVKDAVSIALKRIVEIFGQEDISNLRLEEVEFNPEGQWIITIGFSRPWDYPKLNALGAALIGQAAIKPNRTFKIVKVSDTNGEIIAIKNRQNSD